MRFIHEYYDPVASPFIKVDLRVEINNLGSSITSLRPDVFVVGYTPKRYKFKCKLHFQNTDRSLPPHQPKQFDVSGKVEAHFPFMWLKKYTFGLTKGFNSNLRILNASGKEIGSFDRLLAIVTFKLFNKIKIRTQ